MQENYKIKRIKRDSKEYMGLYENWLSNNWKKMVLANQLLDPKLKDWFERQSSNTEFYN